jgi:hypothetical protein
MRRTLFLAGLLFACISSAGAGQIYKWVDAKGVTHFTAQPPQAGDASVMPHAKQPPAPPAATPTPNQAEIDARVREDVAKKEKERAEYCTTVRTNLAQLQNNPRLRVEDKGVVRRLPEEERQAKIAEAEKAIAENCQ